MRLFSVILSLFVLVLSMAPCLDKDCCDDDTEMASDPEKHTICTPFCGGCASVNIVLEISHIPFEFSEIQGPSPISLYRSIFVSSYIHSFWQPPKLNS